MWVRHVFQAGKTLLRHSPSSRRYAYGKFQSTHEATIGGSFLTKDEELDEHIVKYEIWDTAGQERYHSLAQMYYKYALPANALQERNSSLRGIRCDKQRIV